MITKIPGISLAPPSAPTARAPRLDAFTPMSAAPPSAIVRLSGQIARDPSATYDKPGMPLWQMRSEDPITLRMVRQYDAGSRIGRFSGLGAALVGQFKADGTGFNQAVSAQPGTGATRDALSLKVSTASGKTVTFSLMGSAGELAARTETSDVFDADERAAVASVGNAFQQAIDGLLGRPPKLDLTALAGFAKGPIASVDLSATTAADGAPPMTLALQATAASRAIHMASASGTMDLRVNASEPAMVGTASMRTRAMASTLDQIDRATERGHGNRALAALFKDAFTQLHQADDPASSHANHRFAAVQGGGGAAERAVGLSSQHDRCWQRV